MEWMREYTEATSMEAASSAVGFHQICVYMCVYIYIYTYIYTHISIYMSIYLSIYLSISLSSWLVLFFQTLGLWIVSCLHFLRTSINVIWVCYSSRFLIWDLRPSVWNCANWTYENRPRGQFLPRDYIRDPPRADSPGLPGFPLL